MALTAVAAFRERLAPICRGRQGEVAERAGISRVYLNRVLNGGAVPSLEIAERIADAAGFSLSEVLSSNGDKPPPTGQFAKKSTLSRKSA